MGGSVVHAEQELEKTPDEAINEELDSQFFFYVSEQPNTKYSKLPPEFIDQIMQRMIRFE